MNKRPYTADQVAFLAVFRRLARGETIPPVTFASKAQATSVRMKSYSLLAPYLDGRKDDPELFHAAQKYGISQDGAVLTFGIKKATIAAKTLIEQLGLNESELRQPEEIAMEARFAAMSAQTSERDADELLSRYGKREG